MVLLDLQDMENEEMLSTRGGKSAASKRCSGLSLLIC